MESKEEIGQWGKMKKGKRKNVRRSEGLYKNEGKHWHDQFTEICEQTFCPV